MNNAEKSLDRLLRAAAAHRAEDALEMPYGFATRVAAQWRAGAEKARMELLWFRRAFLCSLAVTMLSVGWSYHWHAAQPQGEDLLVASDDTASADLP